MEGTAEFWREFAVKRGKTPIAKKNYIFHNSLYLHRSHIQRALQNAAHQCMDKTFLTDTTSIETISAQQNQSLAPLFLSIGPGVGLNRTSTGGSMWYNIGCKLAMAACHVEIDANVVLADTPALLHTYEKHSKRFQTWSLTVLSTIAFFRNAPLLLDARPAEWDKQAEHFVRQVQITTTKSTKKNEQKRAQAEATAARFMVAFLKYFCKNTVEGGVQRGAYTQICQDMDAVLTSFSICDYATTSDFVLQKNMVTENGLSLADADRTALAYKGKAGQKKHKDASKVVVLEATKMRLLETVLEAGGADGARQALVERPRRARMPAEVFERVLIELGLADDVGETLDRLRRNAVLQLDFADMLLLPMPANETDDVLSDSSGSQYFKHLSQSVDVSLSSDSSADSGSYQSPARSPRRTRTPTPRGSVLGTPDRRPLPPPGDSPTQDLATAPSPIITGTVHTLSLDEKIRFFTNQFMHEFTDENNAEQQDRVVFCLDKCLDQTLQTYIRQCTTLKEDFTVGLQDMQMLLFGMERVAKVQQARCQRYFVLLQDQANIYVKYASLKDVPLGTDVRDVYVNDALRIDSGDKVFTDKSYKASYVAATTTRQYWLCAKQICTFARAAYDIIDNCIIALRDVRYATDIATAKLNLFQTLKNSQITTPEYRTRLGNDERLMKMHLLTVGLLTHCCYDMLRDHRGSDIAADLEELKFASNAMLLQVKDEVVRTGSRYSAEINWVCGVLLLGTQKGSAHLESSYTSSSRSSYTSSSTDDGTGEQSSDALVRRRGKQPHPSIAQRVALTVAAAGGSSASGSSSWSSSWSG